MLAPRAGVDELVKGVTPDGKAGYLKAQEAISYPWREMASTTPLCFVPGAHASGTTAKLDLPRTIADAILLADDLRLLTPGQALRAQIIRRSLPGPSAATCLPLAANWLLPLSWLLACPLSLVMVTNSMRSTGEQPSGILPGGHLLPRWLSSSFTTGPRHEHYLRPHPHRHPVRCHCRRSFF